MCRIFLLAGIAHGENWFGDKAALCEFVASTCLTSCLCSLLSIGAISLNRYIHICHHNIYSRIYTFKNSICMCVLLWLTSSLMLLPSFIGWGDLVYDKKIKACIWDRTADYSYTLFISIAGIGAPIVLIAICYLKIFLYVHASKKRLSQSKYVCVNLIDSQSMKRMGESMRLARTLFAIFVVFTCCWTPYAIIILGDRYDVWPAETHLFSVLFAHSSSSINWILYGLTNTRFRKGYATLLNITNMRRHDSQQKLTCDEENEVMELATNPECEKVQGDGNKSHVSLSFVNGNVGEA